MKKLFAFISILAVAAAGLFAEITAKKTADGKIEATFFYGNPRATEVLLAGDFTNWQNGALPMTKTDKGFTLTKVFDAGTTVKYKFISDGNWTTDLKAPDFVDDGFGGKNSTAELDALAGGDASAAPEASLKFLTWSMLGAQVKWNNGDDTDLDSAGINLKSYVKFTGYALPKVPVYVEIAVAEQDTFENLYKKDKLDWDDGLKNFAADMIFDPLYWLNGNGAAGNTNAAAYNAGTYLGHFKFGIESDYVNWTTGFKYAKLPPHNINSWITVDKEWEAGYEAVGGFNYFELGSALQQIGPVSLNAAVAPNRSADRAGHQYGMFAWVNASIGPQATFDFQYNGAYGKTFDTIFGHIYETDFIVGYKGIFDPFTITINGLHSSFGDGDLGLDGTSSDSATIYKTKYSPATSDVTNTEPDRNFLAGAAANAQVKFANDFTTTIVGYEMRGVQASMMYVEEGADDHTNISDQLGDLNHQKVWVDANFNVTEALNLGINPYLAMTFDKDYKAPYENEDTLEIGVKPYFTVSFEDYNASLNGYANFVYYTEDEDEVPSVFGTEQYTIKAAGLTFNQTLDSDILKEYKLQYAFDNRDKDYLFNTLISTLSFAKDYTVQAGVGVRTLNTDSKKDDPNNPFAFFIGAYKQIPVLAKPTAYLQFLYAMDPYQKFGDGPTAFKFDSDYENVIDDGVTDYADAFAVRIGLQWDL